MTVRQQLSDKGKSVLFWVLAIISAIPGFLVALASRSPLVNTLFEIDLLIAFVAGVFISSVAGTVAPRKLPPLLAGLITGACLVATSLLGSAYEAIINVVPPPQHLSPLASAVLISIVFVALGGVMGVSLGIILTLGLGVDLTPLTRPGPGVPSAAYINSWLPARLRALIEWTGDVISRHRHHVASAFVGVLVLGYAAIEATKAAVGKGYLMPGHTGFAVGVGAGLVSILFGVAVVMGALCVNGWASRARSVLIVFIDDVVAPQLRVMGRYVLALLGWYVIATTVFSGLYCLAWLIDKNGAFVDQYSHARLHASAITTVRLVALAAGAPFTVNVSGLQPNSPLTEALFSPIETWVNVAIGIGVAAIVRALDKQEKQPPASHSVPGIVTITMPRLSTTTQIPVSIVAYGAASRSPGRRHSRRSPRRGWVRRGVAILGILLAIVLRNGSH